MGTRRGVTIVGTEVSGTPVAESREAHPPHCAYYPADNSLVLAKLKLSEAGQDLLKVRLCSLPPR